MSTRRYFLEVRLQLDGLVTNSKKQLPHLSKLSIIKKPFVHPLSLSGWIALYLL